MFIFIVSSYYINILTLQDADIWNAFFQFFSLNNVDPPPLLQKMKISFVTTYVYLYLPIHELEPVATSYHITNEEAKLSMNHQNASTVLAACILPTDYCQYESSQPLWIFLHLETATALLGLVKKGNWCANEQVL